MGQAMSAREQEPDAHRWPGVALSIQVLLGSCLGCCPNLDAWDKKRHARATELMGGPETRS